MRFLLRFVAILALFFVPDFAQAGAEDASGKCPTGSAGRDFDGLLICVPQGKERYVLTKDGLDWMAWRDDEPVAMPVKDEPSTGDEWRMTLARVWLGEAAVGMADKAAGKGGFDRFMSLMTTSILDAAQRAAPSDEFTTDVPMDEAGLTQRFQFKQVKPDLLQGQPEKTDSGIEFILVRPSSGTERPHVLLCSATNPGGPTYMCMSMRDIDGHRIGIMVAGIKVERSFRIAEEIVSDLETFVVHQAP